MSFRLLIYMLLSSVLKKKKLPIDPTIRKKIGWKRHLTAIWLCNIYRTFGLRDGRRPTHSEAYNFDHYKQPISRNTSATGCNLKLEAGLHGDIHQIKFVTPQ
jgi:hypothetical protein